MPYKTKEEIREFVGNPFYTDDWIDELYKWHGQRKKLKEKNKVDCVEIIKNGNIDKAIKMLLQDGSPDIRSVRTARQRHSRLFKHSVNIQLGKKMFEGYDKGRKT